jgi:imidazolonepropionase-like amidohydrolase
VTAVERQIHLRNAVLWDGTGAPPAAGIDVLVEGGRIAAVGRGLGARVDAEVWDLGGRTLMPGLIDGHVHLTFRGEADEVSHLAPAPVLAWNAADAARRALEAGVTAVRDLGARDAVSVLLRDAVEAGRLPGPRIRAAGQAICMTGGHGWWIGREADGADEVRKAVREQLRAGADCIKLIATGGVMTPRVDPRSPQFTEEELRAGVEEAHKAFLRVAAHAQALEGVKNAVRAGVDSIEHGIYLDDEVVEEMKRRGTFLVPTLVAPHHISRHGLAAGIPAYMVEKSDRVREAHRESFRRAVRAGVRVAMGTDAGTPFNRHGANAEEIALMVEAGMPTAAALLAATRHAAELLDLLDQTGTVEPGKAADLIVVDGDPLADVRVLCDPARIVAVLRAGRWAKQAMHARPAGAGRASVAGP